MHDFSQPDGSFNQVLADPLAVMHVIELVGSVDVGDGVDVIISSRRGGLGGRPAYADEWRTE